MSTRAEAPRPLSSNVVVIGGANVDLVGSPADDLLVGESNPGRVVASSGGVGRNIAENLARLGITTRLLSVVGADLHGDRILSDCRRAGVDVNGVRVSEAGATSCYLAILDGSGDLRLAIAQMDLMRAIDAAFLDERAAVIDDSDVVVVDANLERAAVEHLGRRFGDAVFFVDTVSAAKARRLDGLVGLAHTIKPNRAEAEILTGLTIRDRADLERARRHFLNLGVQRVFISLGEEGLFFGDARGSGQLRPSSVDVVDATGSGDAAMAGLVDGYLRGRSLEDSARFALTLSLLTLGCRHSAYPEVTREVVEDTMKEIVWR